jgi:hypothetical protein
MLAFLSGPHTYTLNFEFPIAVQLFDPVTPIEYEELTEIPGYKWVGDSLMSDEEDYRSIYQGPPILRFIDTGGELWILNTNKDLFHIGCRVEWIASNVVQVEPDIGCNVWFFTEYNELYRNSCKNGFRTLAGIRMISPTWLLTRDYRLYQLPAEGSPSFVDHVSSFEMHGLACEYYTEIGERVLYTYEKFILGNEVIASLSLTRDNFAVLAGDALHYYNECDGWCPAGRCRDAIGLKIVDDQMSVIKSTGTHFYVQDFVNWRYR